MRFLPLPTKSCRHAKIWAFWSYLSACSSVTYGLCSDTQTLSGFVSSQTATQHFTAELQVLETISPARTTLRMEKDKFSASWVLERSMCISHGCSLINRASVSCGCKRRPEWPVALKEACAAIEVLACTQRLCSPKLSGVDTGSCGSQLGQCQLNTVGQLGKEVNKWSTCCLPVWWTQLVLELPCYL